MGEVLQFEKRPGIRERWEKDFSIDREEDISDLATSVKNMSSLHHDSEEARKAGFLGIIAPVAMLTGFILSAIEEEISEAQVRQMDLKFIRPLYAGSLPTVSCRVLMQNQRFATIAVAIRNGADIVAEGSCRLKLPQIRPG